MATLSVAAVVVSHGQPELLAQCLGSLEAQTHPIQQVVVVETAGDESCLDLAKSFGFSVITPGDIRLGSAINAGISSLNQAPGWIWVMHDDAVAEPKALQELAKAAEISPSVAIIGPKLLDLESPIQIQQMGLTATKTGRPFLLVRREYDQGQHDKAGDTLAVSTAGMLISLGVWQQLGGLDDSSPTLAQDLELGIRARAAGYRVVVEASARIQHAGLSMASKRTRGWIGGSVATALAKAHVHGATLLLPLPVLVGLYLLMPLYVLFSFPLNLLAKRPGRTLGQLVGWLWAWSSVGQRFAARSRLRALGSLQGVKSLLASNREVRKRRRSVFESEPERAESELLPGIFRSNSIWFAALPMLAAIRLFPQGAIFEGAYVPLGSNLKQVWDAVGAQPLPILEGVIAPSDPFNWLLAFAALINPTNPSIAFTTVAFMAPLAAFLGAWQLGKLFIATPWAITLSSLLYSLSPQLLLLIGQSGIVESIAIALWPWVIYLALRALRSYNAARAWRWTGLAALALAALAVTNLVLALLAFIAAIASGLFSIRRLAIVIWSLVPASLLIYPWAKYLIDKGEYEHLTATSALYLEPQFHSVDLIAIGLLGFVALFSWFGSSFKAVFGLWLLALSALALSWYQPVVGSDAVLTAGLLPLSILVGMTISKLKYSGFRRLLGAGLALVPLASLVIFGPLAQPPVNWKDDRVVPALVWAAAQQDQSVRTLVIDTSNQIAANYLWGAGATLEQQSIAAKHHVASAEFKQLIADATANLIAGNGEKLGSVLSKVRVDFVLLQNPDREVEVSISQIPTMQPAGTTEFGTLWKVVSDTPVAVASQKIDPIRNWQLGSLAVFALLAIPTRASIRGYRRTSDRGER